MDEHVEPELERRLRLMEDPESGEGALAPLPLADLVLSIVGLSVLTVLLLWWSL